MHSLSPAREDVRRRVVDCCHLQRHSPRSGRQQKTTANVEQFPCNFFARHVPNSQPRSEGFSLEMQRLRQCASTTGWTNTVPLLKVSFPPSLSACPTGLRTVLPKVCRASGILLGLPSVSIEPSKPGSFGLCFAKILEKSQAACCAARLPPRAPGNRSFRTKGDRDYLVPMTP